MGNAEFIYYNKSSEVLPSYNVIQKYEFGIIPKEFKNVELNAVGFKRSSIRKYVPIQVKLVTHLESRAKKYNQEKCVISLMFTQENHKLYKCVFS